MPKTRQLPVFRAFGLGVFDQGGNCLLPQLETKNRSWTSFATSLVCAIFALTSHLHEIACFQLERTKHRQLPVFGAQGANAYKKPRWATECRTQRPTSFCLTKTQACVLWCLERAPDTLRAIRWVLNRLGTLKLQCSSLCEFRKGRGLIGGVLCTLCQCTYCHFS